MHLDLSGEKPIYLQISEELEDAIFTGAFPEEAQIPSTTEISTRFTINPATVLKGMNQLVEQGIIYKKRGVGMFVQSGAVQKIREKRQEQFYDHYIRTLLDEAKKLGLTREEILQMLERGLAK